MVTNAPNPSLSSREILAAWRGILGGSAPMLSIEITRECPLSCPGCYAYGESHLGSGVTLRELKDLRYFKQVDLAFGTVQWPHEQDISPETLYLEALPVSDNGDGNG